jgi:hypothetical protein
MTTQERTRLFRDASGVERNDTGGVYFEFDVTCDELSVESACCYGVDVEVSVVGRPFRVDGVIRSADTTDGGGWSMPGLSEDAPISRRARRRLARAWARNAHGEHASVAAFSRFVWQLMHIGAPADLVAGATQAMADEVRHAQLSYGVARGFAGTPIEPGGLDTSGALASAGDWAEIVLDTVREGCIAETIAAHQAAVARDGCAHPRIRCVLAEIAEDELRHAELAWAFVRWALTERPDLTPAVAAVFRQGLDLEPVSADPMAKVLRDHGVLSAHEMQAVACSVFQEVVLPCASSLCGHSIGVGLAA